MSVLTDLRQLRGEVGDVVARHEQAKGIVDFARYANDPAGFCRDVLRCEPWSKQIEMAEAIRDYPRTVVVTANGLGKDWMTARAALWWLYARRGFVILTGPTERQTKQILMREVRRAFTGAPELPGELFSLELRVNDDCGLLAFTSDNANKLTGFHHERLLIAVTEGQGVEDDAYEAAHACCTAPGNRLFVYGNPTVPTGAFYRAAQSDAWHHITIPASMHPNVISGRPDIPGAVSREWIASIAAEYGTDSAVYKSRVEAIFPDEAAEGCFRREWIRAAFDRHDAKTFADVSWQHRVTFGTDIAASLGGDKTSVAICRGPVLERFVMWRARDLTVTEDRLVALAMEHTAAQPNPKFPAFGAAPRFVVDEVGVGAGCPSQLRRRGQHVQAFNGGNRALANSKYLNARSEWYWTFRELLMNNKVALPRDTDLEEELLATEWQPSANGRLIQIIGKDLIRQTLGRSPDKADAACMGMVYANSPRLRREVVVHELFI